MSERLPPSKPEGTGTTAVDGLTGPVGSHVLPFVLWLFAMLWLGEPAGWKYGVRSVICAAALVYCKPWRWYGPLRPRHLPLAAGIGGAVFLLWIALETEAASRWPVVQDLYLTWFVFPWGSVPAAVVSPVYAPDVSGWGTTLVRITGSAAVISIIEEFFWRGFIYRWLADRDFLAVDLGHFRLWPFLGTALFFGLEHQRWLAGVGAGVLYGWMAIRTRDLWAVAMAHGVTNLLLGLYVVATGQYQFWS